MKNPMTSAHSAGHGLAGVRDEVSVGEEAVTLVSLPLRADE